MTTDIERLENIAMTIPRHFKERAALERAVEVLRALPVVHEALEFYFEQLQGDDPNERSEDVADAIDLIEAVVR